MKINFNFFTKPQNDLSKTTFTGAILSLLTVLSSMFFILYLAISRIPITHKNFVISKQGSNNEIRVDIDIVFLNAPCAALRLQKEDPANFQQTTIHSGLTFTRVNNNKIIPDSFIDSAISSQYPDEDEIVKLLLTGLKDNERCKVTGTFHIKRIPGAFEINHELVYTYLSQVKQESVELYKKLNLAHTVVSLSFGNENEKIAEKISYDKSKPMSCLYYLKLIPNNNSENYKYSINHECFVFL